MFKQLSIFFWVQNKMIIMIIYSKLSLRELVKHPLKTQ